jgi:hypothetical protein
MIKTKIFPVSIIIIVFILASSFNPVSAVDFDTGIQFRTAFPQGEFNRHVKNNGFGLGGHAGVMIPNSPVMIGADLGFMIYGYESRNEPFSSTIPDVTVDVETSNNIFTGHLFLRLQPPQNTIRPYFDALFGFNYFFTQTSIKDEDGSGEDIASTTNLDDFALSYGVGGGIQIRVYHDPYETKELSSVFIDIGVRYLTGGEAEYLKKGSIEIVDQKVMKDIITSRTDLLHFQLGVGFAF